MNKHRVSSLSVLILLGFISHAYQEAWALDPSKEIAQYSRRVWLKKEGLPQNSVLAMAQTPDGYLWLGTMEGLARFDGRSFVVFNYRNTPLLSTPVITALSVGSDSSLWIGSSGGGVVKYKDRRFSQIKGSPSFQNSMVRTIREDRHGTVWASTTGGLAAIRGDSVVKIYRTSDGLPFEPVYSLAEDADGNLLAGTRGGISMLVDDCFRPYPPTAHKEMVAVSLLKDHRGRLWIGTYARGVICLDRDSARQFSLSKGHSSNWAVSLTEDANGAVWAATATGGVCRIFGDSVSSFTTKDGLPVDETHAIFEDREKNIWVGLSGGGLIRFVDPKFVTFTLGPATSQNMAWSVYEDHRGRILAGNAEGNLFDLRGGGFTPVKDIPLPLNSVAYALFEDRKGYLWIGTAKGVYRSGKGHIQYFPYGFTSAILEDSFGRIWLGGSGGLLMYDGGRFIKCRTAKGEWAHDIRQLYEDKKGTLWLGARMEGILTFPLNAVKSDGILPEVTKRPQREVMAICGDDSGAVWVSTFGGGLCRYDGEQTVTYTTSCGLPSDVLYKAIDDGSGHFWISTNNGVFRVSIRSLREYARGTRTNIDAVNFGPEDGMLSDECNGGNQSSGLRAKSGKLFFPTTWGVVMVDPASLPTNTVPPTVVIDRIVIDHTEFSSKGEFSCPPGDGQMEFQYAGISFSAAERVRFKTMLEGFDHSWVDSDTRTTARYTNIPPGDYTFRVMACNGDGIWNEAGTAASFVLRPHFYQTIWFYTLCGLLVMLVGAGVHSLYRRDRDRQLIASQLESKLAQAQLKVLEMQLQPHFLFNTLNGIMVLIHHDPDKATKMLARLSEFLRSTLERTGDQEVPLQKELDLVHRYLDIEQIRFGDRLTVSNNVCNQLRDALVPSMILQPLVENAIRHGVAKRRGQAWIQINAEQSDGKLVLSVRDNGAGVGGQHPSDLREGVGLGNTRARLKQLYGDAFQFTLTTPAAGGFEVSFAIPLHKSGATI